MSVTRKIVSADKSALVDQRVKCIQGVLTDMAVVAASMPTKPAKVCEYWNFTAVNGEHTKHTLLEGSSVTRNIVNANDTALVPQTVKCVGGVLMDASR